MKINKLFYGRILEDGIQRENGPNPADERAGNHGKSNGDLHGYIDLN